MTNELNDMARGAPKQVSDQELIDMAGSVDGPAFTVAELVDQSPIGYERMRQRLKILENGRLIQTKKIGGTRMYWFEDDGRD
jgi:hypothetical protein